MRLVYSSDCGKICPECQKPTTNCICAEKSRSAILGDGNVKLRRETSGRAGKTVVVIAGLPLNKTELQSLLKELKHLCGCGGTIKEGTIEIQGEHLDKLRQALHKRGYRPKG